MSSSKSKIKVNMCTEVVNDDVTASDNQTCNDHVEKHECVKEDYEEVS